MSLDLPGWFNQVLASSLGMALAILIMVSCWSVKRLKYILAVFARRDRARAELRLEDFHDHDTEYVSKFNRNFHRIALVCRGERAIEHNFIGMVSYPTGELIPGKCGTCGMKADEFYKANHFKGCVDGE